jgi:hypothetical protein
MNRFGDVMIAPIDYGRLFVRTLLLDKTTTPERTE